MMRLIAPQFGITDLSVYAERVPSASKEDPKRGFAKIQAVENEPDIQQAQQDLEPLRFVYTTRRLSHYESAVLLDKIWADAGKKPEHFVSKVGHHGNVITELMVDEILIQAMQPNEYGYMLNDYTTLETVTSAMHQGEQKDDEVRKLWKVAIDMAKVHHKNLSELGVF